MQFPLRKVTESSDFLHQFCTVNLGSMPHLHDIVFLITFALAKTLVSQIRLQHTKIMATGESIPVYTSIFTVNAGQITGTTCKRKFPVSPSLATRKHWHRLLPTFLIYHPHREFFDVVFHVAIDEPNDDNFRKILIMIRCPKNSKFLLSLSSRNPVRKS